MVGREEKVAEINSVWNCYGIQEEVQYLPKKWPSDEEVISMVRIRLDVSGL